MLFRSVNTENTLIGTRPYIAGGFPFSHDVNWSSNDFSFTANGDLTFDSTITTILAGSTLFSGNSFTINNYAQDGEHTMTSNANYIINPSSSFDVLSGSETSRGQLSLSATNININTVDLSLLSASTETQPTGNILISATSTFDITSLTLDVDAKSTVEEQQGTIDIDMSGTQTYTSNTLAFTSMNAGFNSQSDQTLDVLVATRMSTLTHGLNAGIDLFGKTMTPIITATFTSTAGIHHEMVAANGNLDMVHTGSLSVTSDGKASNDDAGIQFKTDSDAAIIDFSTTTTLFDTNGSFDVHATDSIVSSSFTNTAINSKYASFKTVGLGNNLAGGNQPVGMQITAATMNFATVTDDISFSATGTVTTSYTTGPTTFDGASTYYTAHGTVQLEVDTVTHTTASSTINFISHENGITFAGEDANFALTAAGTVNFHTGLLHESAAFRVTGGSIDISSLAVNTLSADNNALFQSDGITTLTSGDDTFIDATKGDILFRSIDSPNDANYHELRFTAQDITMTAYYRIEHRQHQELGFFNPSAQPSRTSVSYVRQPTSPPSGGISPLGPNANGCLCIAGCNPASVGCPSITARVVQMQAALEAYGLLKYTT